MADTLEAAGDQVVKLLVGMGITHVIWLPDSAIGGWEHALASANDLTLIRVCREGEAWAIAAGLHLGGARPLVMIQNTGLFESGDALRNVLFDLRLPIFSIIGYRSYLIADSKDSAKRFTEPVLAAWGIDTAIVHRPDELPKIAEHFERCQQANRPGAVLIAEGRM